MLLGVDKGMVERYANLLNCNIFDLPFVYLGLLIETKPWRVEM